MRRICTFALLAILGRFTQPRSPAADWAPEDRSAYDPLGQRHGPGSSIAGISAADDGPPRLAEPQWPVGICDSPKGRGQAGQVRRPNLRPIPGRVGAVGRDEASRPRQPALVPAGVHRPGEVVGQAPCCISERATGRRPSGSTARNSARTGAAMTRSRSTSPDNLTEQARPGTGRRRLGPDRRRAAAARQAGPQARRHLVHADDRHLADGLAGAGAQDVHRRLTDRSRTWTERKGQVVVHVRCRGEPKDYNRFAIVRDGSKTWESRGPATTVRGANSTDIPSRNFGRPNLPSFTSWSCSLQGDGGKITDEVESYFAMRKISASARTPRASPA